MRELLKGSLALTLTLRSSCPLVRSNNLKPPLQVYRHPSCLIKHRKFRFYESTFHLSSYRNLTTFLGVRMGTFATLAGSVKVLAKQASAGPAPRGAFLPPHPPKLNPHAESQIFCQAAAILSHISPSANGGTSLPEDRSLWPSFLSGGLLPPPSTANSLPYNSTSSSTNGNSTSNSSMHTPAPTLSSSSLETHLTYPISSSVPAGTSGMGMVGPGPRMHDYAILGKKGGVTDTHVRPGVLGVSTGSSSSSSPPLASLNVQSSSMNGNGEQQVSTRPMPVPVPLTTNGYGYLGRDGYRDGGFSFMSGTGTEDSWGSPVSLMMHAISSSVRSSACEEACEGSRGSGKVGGGGEGGWSLPRSSIRSSGSGSGSRSRSASKSDEDEEDEEVRDEFGGEELDVDVMDVDGIGMRGGIGGVQHGQKYGFVSRGRRVGVVGSKGRFRGWGEEEGELEVHEEKVEEEWDGMEMDMEM